MTAQATTPDVPAPKLGAAPGSASARLRVPGGLGLSAEDVDSEKEVLKNCIIAQAGPFKSDGRGEFDMHSLTAIIALAEKNALGIRCNYCHRDESHDGLGRHLGRFKDFRLSSVGPRESDGETVADTVACVRADLHIDPTSHKTPEGDLGGYVLGLATSDPQAISSSMVIATDYEYRINPDGTRMRDADEEQLPPLWRPTKLMSADIVAVGDAVDGLLSHGLAIDSLPDAVLHRGAELLDRQFAGKPRAFVAGRCLKFLARYLDRRYGAQRPQGGGLRLAAGDQPDDSQDGDSRDGGPDGKDHPDDIPEGSGEPKELHDGCRSTLAYHHLTLCRLCGGTIAACGCKDVAKESRVITMAKEPCGKCLAAGEGGNEAGGDTVPDGGPKQSGDVEDARKRLAALLG